MLESPESKFKGFPMQIHNNHNKTSDGEAQENYRNEVGSHHQDAEKSTPAKDNEPSGGKKSRDSPEQAANALNKTTVDTHVDGVPGSDARKSSSSSSKTSKLPPVCLRVDPLPRKKGRNDSSRSPSPPGSEAKSRSSCDASSTDSNEQSSHAQSMKRTPEDHPKRKQVKVIEVKGDSPSPSKNNSGELQSSLQVEHPQKIKENKDHTEEEEEAAFENKENKEATTAGDENTEKRSKELEASKTLSNEEAAMRIQSAFRGFQVRKWETLKKLKQMAKVRDELTKMRKSIEELASTYDTSPYQGGLERQKALIGESIMNLLLRLDTIQGIHPDLRDIRKSLARELVALQEELDSVTMKNLEESVDNSDISRNDECAVSKKEFHEETQRQFEESLSVCEDVGGQLKSDELNLLQAEDSVSEPSENACSAIINGQTQVAVQDVKSETSASSDVESHLIQNETDYGEPPVVSIMEHTETEHPTGEKNEKLEFATMDKSYYDSAVEDESSLASILGDGSSTKMEFMGEHQGTSALQPLSQAAEEKGATVSDNARVEPDSLTGPTFCTGDDELISLGKEPEVEAASKIHIAQENVADYVASEHDKLGEVDPVLSGHDKCNEGSDDVTSPENFGKPTIETEQVEVPKAISEVVDNVHEEQLAAPGLDDLSPAGSLKSEATSQDASNGAERDQRHEDANLLPPGPEETQLGMLGSTETCRDVNEDKAIISADLNCNSSNMLNGEAVGPEKEELIAENVENIDLTAYVREQVNEQEDDHEDVAVVAPEKPISDEGAEQVEHSPTRVDDSNVSRPGEEMDRNEKLIKENEKLREMMEKLMEAGKQQLHVISELTGRVKDLERRLPRNNKRVKSRCRTVAAKPRSLHYAKSLQSLQEMR